MPEFDMRHVQAAEYTKSGSTVSYGTATSLGEAMTANLELRFAEGRLYAEGALAEYLRKAVGGTISIGTKYIPTAGQKLLFGVTDKSRTVRTNHTVTGLKTTAKDVQKTVGVSFYAPAMVDGVEKYTCVFIPRCRFGQPSMSFQTMGESITFNTPTTTGEFMPDQTSAMNLLEVAVCDNLEDAVAWCSNVFTNV